MAAQREVLHRLETGNRPEEIRKARADMEAATADLHNAELTAERVFKLAAQGAATPQGRTTRGPPSMSPRAKAAAQEPTL